MKEEIEKLEDEKDFINEEFDNVKEALELIEKAMNDLEEYIDDEENVNFAHDYLFSARVELRSQLELLKSREDEIIEEEEMLEGSYTEDDLHMSQWEFIPHEK